MTVVNLPVNLCAAAGQNLCGFRRALLIDARDYIPADAEHSDYAKDETGESG
jgi:hypothetical protein